MHFQHFDKHVHQKCTHIHVVHACVLNSGSSCGNGTDVRGCARVCVKGNEDDDDGVPYFYGWESGCISARRTFRISVDIGYAHYVCSTYGSAERFFVGCKLNEIFFWRPETN